MAGFTTILKVGWFPSTTMDLANVVPERLCPSYRLSRTLSDPNLRHITFYSPLSTQIQPISPLEYYLGQNIVASPSSL